MENLLNFVVIEITIKSYHNGPNLNSNDSLLEYKNLKQWRQKLLIVSSIQVQTKEYTSGTQQSN